MLWNVLSPLNFHSADLLRRSKPSRIVIVASELYRIANVNMENTNPVNVFPVYLYYVSKYANIMFTLELARRLEGSGKCIIYDTSFT